ncbi:MAG: peptidase M48 [Planctomycetes bacterium]|nr:peptidase M48 [Planctomycetota bacterium]
MSANRTILMLPLFLLSLAALLTGCESQQIGDFARDISIATGQDPQKAANIGRIASKTVEAGRAAFVPIAEPEEVAIGQSVALQAFERFGPYCNDPEVQRYVNLVGNAVAYTSDRPKLEYRFAVVESKELNAFAAPGGYIFITTGLLRAVKNEAELAGVLGHEIAHVSKKHALGVIQRSKVLTNLADAAATAMKQDPKTFAAAVDLVNEILFDKGLDRNLEYEADQIGTDFAHRVGYQASGLRDFCLTLKNVPGTSTPSLLKTHPNPADRVAKLDGYLSKRLRPDPSALTLQARYQQGTRNLR